MDGREEGKEVKALCRRVSARALRRSAMPFQEGQAMDNRMC
jgi:hypothetical protein